jgi:hypothetical protein
MADFEKVRDCRYAYKIKEITPRLFDFIDTNKDSLINRDEMLAFLIEIMNTELNC